MKRAVPAESDRIQFALRLGANTETAFTVDVPEKTDYAVVVPPLTKPLVNVMLVPQADGSVQIMLSHRDGYDVDVITNNEMDAVRSLLTKAEDGTSITPPTALDPLKKNDVPPPENNRSPALEFSITTEPKRQPIAVTVPAKAYEFDPQKNPAFLTTAGVQEGWREDIEQAILTAMRTSYEEDTANALLQSAWLRHIEMSIRTAMETAGKLAPTDPQEIKAAYIEPKLVFYDVQGRDLTLWEDIDKSTEKTTTATVASSIRGATSIESIVGGHGNNLYAFDNSWDTSLSIQNDIDFLDAAGNFVSIPAATLDFRDVTRDLTFKISKDSVRVSETGNGNSPQVTASNVANLIAEKGQNTYKFLRNGQLQGSIDATASSRSIFDYCNYELTTATTLRAAVAAEDISPSTTAVAGVLPGLGISDVIGGGKRDRIVGDDQTTANDLDSVHKLQGGDGNDTITGGASFDLIYGGDGNDTLNGKQGIDDVYGGPGDDRLISETDQSNDVLRGEAGNDTYSFSGDWGQDTVVEQLYEGLDKLDFSQVTAPMTHTLSRGVIRSGNDTFTLNAAQQAV